MSQRSEHQMFSKDFLDHLVRHFNGVIKYGLLDPSINRLEIKFERFNHANRNVVVSLFTKLVEAFKVIKEKYIHHHDQHTNVRLELDDTEEYFIITVYGIMYIPPGKLLNLFSLILWYYIRYKTGDKPANTSWGNKLTEEWKEEEKLLRYEINQSPRRLKVRSEGGPCYICGDESFAYNDWEFRSHKTSRTITMETRVCNKHRSRLI